MNYDEVCFFSFPKLFLICSFLYRWMMISVKLSHLAGWFGCKFQAPPCWSNCLIKKCFILWMFLGWSARSPADRSLSPFSYWALSVCPDAIFELPSGARASWRWWDFTLLRWQRLLYPCVMLISCLAYARSRMLHPGFQHHSFFLSLDGALQCDAVIFLLSVNLH